MSELGSFIKRLRDIMRNDAGINGDAQRIEQIAWMLFLRVYDAKEDDWEIDEKDYESIIPEECRWRNWAHDDGSGNAITGDALLDFVNNTLFPTLKNLSVTPDTPIKKAIVKTTFEDTNQYMKDGVLLRHVLNVIDAVDFGDYKESHAFGQIYEDILKELQSAGASGEFYTPRAVTDFMAKMINPQVGEQVADFACGTGGFLTSWMKELEPKVKTTEDREAFGNSIYGIEKKQFPYMLCVTNMLLHEMDVPKIYHDNSLLYDVLDYGEDDKFDVILMNPPYGGSEKNDVKQHFPADLASSETADLFMTVIMYRLKETGRAAVVLPDMFLSSTEGAKKTIKEKLIKEFNLHTIVRLPQSTFSPYTDIATNILFFDQSKHTESTWFYRLDIPECYKHFSKTKPICIEHFEEVISWWNDRSEIKDVNEDPEAAETWKSKLVTISEIQNNDYNIDYCGYPHEEEIILSPKEVLNEYMLERAALENALDVATEALKKSLDGENVLVKNIGPAAKKLSKLNFEFPEKMRMSLLQAAVRGQLLKQEATDSEVHVDLELSDNEWPYEIPENWKWTTFESVCNYIQRGKSPKYSLDETIPVVSQKCVQWSGFDITKAQFIDTNTIENYKEERVLQQDDVLINSTGLGTLGRMCLFPKSEIQYERVVADSHVTVARLKTTIILPHFLFAYWANPSVQNVIESQATGSTKQKELGLGILKKYPIPIPPIEEQQRIVERLNVLLPLCESIGHFDL